MLVYDSGFTSATPVVEVVWSNGNAYRLALTYVMIGCDASNSGLPGMLCLNIALPAIVFETLRRAQPCDSVALVPAVSITVEPPTGRDPEITLLVPAVV